MRVVTVCCSTFVLLAMPFYDRSPFNNRYFVYLTAGCLFLLPRTPLPFNFNLPGFDACAPELPGRLYVYRDYARFTAAGSTLRLRFHSNAPVHR